jgi:hypothetical protein
MQRDCVGLAMLATEKVLEESMDDEARKRAARLAAAEVKKIVSSGARPVPASFAKVVSGARLDSEEAALLMSLVTALAGRQIPVVAAVEPALMGGFLITVGDTRIDASVRGKLERLGAHLQRGAATQQP